MLRGSFFLGLCICGLVVFSTPIWAAPTCASLLAGIEKAEPGDWTHKDKSLPAVVANSAVWLTGAESTRLLSEASAFGTAFLANTSIDIILTAISHQISMGNVPDGLKKYFEGKESYKRRTLVNTTMAMVVLLPIWTIAAAAGGAEVGDLQAWLHGEVIHPLGAPAALALFYSAYWFAPYFKNYLFQSMPQRADARAWQDLQNQEPEALRALEAAARKRASELELDSQSFENLVMSMVEVVRLRIPYENKLSSLLLEDASVRKWADRIQTASNDYDEARFRKKLIKRLLQLHDNTTYKIDVEEALSLGEPFTGASSVRVHTQLNRRDWKSKIRLALTAFADQSLWVGLLGGVVLRGITGFAIGPSL